MKKINARGSVRSLITVGITYSLSFILWTIWYFGFDRSTISGIGFLERLLLNSDIIYIAVWLLPALGLLLFVSYSAKSKIKPFIPFHELFDGKIGALRLFLSCLVFTGFTFILQIINNGFDFSNIRFDSTVFSRSLFAAVCEEIVFRGVFQNILKGNYKSRFSCIMVGALFSLYHLPDIIYGGALLHSLKIGTFLVLFLFSLWLSRSFEKDGNLFTPMILHFVWDVLMYSI